MNASRVHHVVMSDPTPIPDAATLRALSVKHEVDPRTIVRYLRGLTVHGARASQCAKAAGDEWRKSVARKGGK